MPGLPSGHGGRSRVTQGRVRVSTRMTSAPRWASWSVQYGPAQTQVKSAILTPSSGSFAIVSDYSRSARSYLACSRAARSDHTRAPQLLDPRRRQAQTRAENLLVMLAERRRRRANLPWRTVVLQRRAGLLVGPRHRMGYLDEEAALLQMVGTEQVAHGRDRRERDAPRLRLLVEVKRALLLEPVLQENFECVPVDAALEPVGEDFFRRPLRVPHHLDEVAPLMLLDAADENVTVAALHHLERLDRLLPQPRGDHVHVGPELEEQLHLRGQRFVDRNVDVLALAVAHLRKHRAHRRHRRMHPALETGLMTEGLERRHLGMLCAAAVDVADAASAPERQILGAPVALGTALPPRRNRGHHQARIAGAQALEAEPDTVHVGRRDVVKQNVSAGDQPLEQLEALGTRHVERGAELVGVEIKVEPAFFRMCLAAGKRAAQTSAVAGARPLALDDLGAHVGHQLGRVGCGNHLAQLDDFKS